ncbi:hypothetical protein [Catellatospora chokoriensis]|uniref:hypothetical protein n=1 Tax=Catellatospora chokoriensis TaxID=310353 RepID=UPI00178478AA|nr:hypothetical protein [Catellatospora chokoriensis]
MFVIPVTTDRRLLLLRHDAGTHAYWTYPTMLRGTMRTDTGTIARRLVRQHLGIETDRTHLLGILEPTRGRPRSAIYTANLTQAATDILGTRAAETGRRPAMQALVVTAATLAALDVRPHEITALLCAGGDPAQFALTLPDLASGAEAPTTP